MGAPPGECRDTCSTVRTRELQRYLRWCNADARHPDVPAAQRRERARIRSQDECARLHKIVAGAELQEPAHSGGGFNPLTTTRP